MSVYSDYVYGAAGGIHAGWEPKQVFVVTSSIGSVEDRRVQIDFAERDALTGQAWERLTSFMLAAPTVASREWDFAHVGYPRAEG